MSGREIPVSRARRLGPALLPLAFLLCVTVFESTAYADPIILTGGEIVVDRTRGIATVNLTGLNFSLSYVDDLQFSAGFGPGRFGTSTFNCGCDGGGRATFDGFSTLHFTGGGTYDTASIFGTIRLYNSPGTPPVFTLDYAGTGFLASDSRTFTRFVITGGVPSAVPEPGTMLLLGTGLAGLAAGVRKRRRAATPDGAPLKRGPEDGSG